MPPLFVIGPEGEGQLVNYRIRRNYIIVDRLFAAAELRLGDHQQAVRIVRTMASGARRADSSTLVHLTAPSAALRTAPIHQDAKRPA